MPEEVKRGPGRPPLGGPGSGESDPVSLRFPTDVRQKVQKTATDAELTERAFIRKAAEICCSPDELKKALLEIYDDDESRDPEMRKFLDAMRRNSKSPRMRARAGRFNKA